MGECRLVLLVLMFVSLPLSGQCRSLRPGWTVIAVFFVMKMLQWEGLSSRFTNAETFTYLVNKQLDSVRRIRFPLKNIHHYKSKSDFKLLKYFEVKKLKFSKTFAGKT